LPLLTPLLVPVLRGLQETPWLLNAFRMGVAFLLLLVPSTAMGATLPLLVRELYARDPRFGSVLGKLYGWNTLGAVAGAVSAHTLWIGWFGVRGAALTAAAANLVAAALAFGLAARRARAAAPAPDPEPGTIPRRALALPAAAFVTGGVLLALEVVWFRFLLLFIHGNSLAFALMLGVVLAGIGLGGLLGSLWLARSPGAFRALPFVAAAAGLATIATYQGFQLVQAAVGDQAVTRWLDMLRLGLPLMLPVSLLSGIAFTLLGEALDRAAPAQTRSAGVLTLANTTGAALGSLLGGFVLLPLVGIEASIRILAACYLAAALLAAVAGARPEEPAGTGIASAACIALVAWVMAFPSSLMERAYLSVPIGRLERAEGAVAVEIREGLTETAIYLRRDRFGEPLDHRLLTNSYSMSATTLASHRYMKLFVYLPVAIHPEPRRALLISYGVGGTAKALTDWPEFERIDVVDVSRDILEMNRIAYPEPGSLPLDDPRVVVHVEDGRHFLQTTEERFDLITGEPPPPKAAGIVSLYTREYFELAHARLSEGGVLSYWLPVHSLLEDDAKNITAAFCAVFSDCTLWGGSGLDWILLGTRGVETPVSEERFRAQWRNPKVRAELRRLGFERPEQLGATFMADPEMLRVRLGDAPLLEDDHPKRLSDRIEAVPQLLPDFLPWMDTTAAREGFAASEIVERLWPASLVQGTLAEFDHQAAINAYFTSDRSLGLRNVPGLHEVLSKTGLETLPLWLLGSDDGTLQAAERAHARGRRGLPLDFHRAAGALARRDYERAAAGFGRAAERRNAPRPVVHLQVYALCMAGRLEEAAEVMRARGIGTRAAERELVRFLEATFGVRAG
ncbi:MAG: spermidine synthase, partial [Myxococcota bacterium]|nr:spermidine synthase [Myxococcota bacterium]